MIFFPSPDKTLKRLDSVYLELPSTCEVRALGGVKRDGEGD